MSELLPGDHVRYLDNHSWSPAIVIKKLDEPRSYIIGTTDSVELRRNRKHLRRVTSYAEALSDLPGLDDIPDVPRKMPCRIRHNNNQIVDHAQAYQQSDNEPRRSVRHCRAPSKLNL